MVGAELSVSTGTFRCRPQLFRETPHFFLPGPLSPPPDIPVWVSAWVKLAYAATLVLELYRKSPRSHSTEWWGNE